MMMLMMMVGSGDDAQEFTLNYIGATRFAFHSLVVDTWEVGNQYLSLGLGISSSYSEAIDTQRLETVYRVHIICRGRQTAWNRTHFHLWRGIAYLARCRCERGLRHPTPARPARDFGAMERARGEGFILHDARCSTVMLSYVESEVCVRVGLCVNISVCLGVGSETVAHTWPQAKSDEGI